MGFVLYSLFVSALQMGSSFSEHPRANEFRLIVENLLETKFTELKNKKIEIRKFKNQDRYFFYTFAEDVLHPFKRRTYIVRVNEKIMNNPPDRDALEAILAHELQHLTDYSKMNIFQLGYLVFQYEFLKNPKYIQKYERQTDRNVIAKGFEKGLMKYRIWLYKHIPADEIPKKKKNYYTPEEIISSSTNEIKN